MPFLDHLEELRWRILYSLLALVVGTLIGWVVVERVDIIGLLTRPIAPLIPGGKLRVTSPTEPFFITLKFAFVLGLLIASPFVGYHAWAFLVPALYPRERRLIVPALSAGVVLFLAGATAAYLWLLPRALALLLGIQRGVFDPLITADKYFGFAARRARRSLRRCCSPQPAHSALRRPRCGRPSARTPRCARRRSQPAQLAASTPRPRAGSGCPPGPDAASRQATP